MAHRNHRIKTKTRASEATLESFFYEIKPILYLAFASLVIKFQPLNNPIIKFATVLVLIFSLYIIYGRLQSRGHIK